MFQEHRGLTLTINLNFLELIKGITRNHAYIHIYKTFIRKESDYADIIRNHAYNYIPLFPEELESIQYNTCLTITEVIGCTSSKTLYQD